MIELPTEKIPATAIDPRVIVLYSKPKIGKTSVLSALPNNLILDTEEGTDMISAVKMTIIGLKRYMWEYPETPEQIATRHAAKKYYLFEVIKALREKMAATGKKPYHFISVDTVTRLEEFCEADATETYMKSAQGKNWNRWTDDDQERNGKNVAGQLKPMGLWEPVTKLGKGYGYRWLWESYEKWFNYIKPLCNYLILSGHVKLVTIVKKEGSEVDQKDLDLTGKVKSMTTSKFADAIGYIYREGTDNFVSFVPSDEVSCGSRAAHLEGQTILLSRKKEDKSIETYWQNIFTHLVAK
jgi:hypothetical protein